LRRSEGNKITNRKTMFKNLNPFNFLLSIFITIACNSEQKKINNTRELQASNNQEYNCDSINSSRLDSINFYSINNLEVINGIRGLRFGDNINDIKDCLFQIDTLNDFISAKCFKEIRYLGCFWRAELRFKDNLLFSIKLETSNTRDYFSLNQEIVSVYGKPNLKDQQIDSTHITSDIFTFMYYESNTPQDFSQELEDEINLLNTPPRSTLPSEEDMNKINVKSPATPMLDGERSKYPTRIPNNHELFDTPEVYKWDVNLKFVDFIRLISEWGIKDYSYTFKLTKTTNVYDNFVPYSANFESNKLASDGYIMTSSNAYVIEYTCDKNALSIFFLETRKNADRKRQNEMLKKDSTYKSDLLKKI